MAHARRVKETIVKREKVDRIQLVLTDGEADFLQAVLAFVGGSPQDSPRKYQERISSALQEVTGQEFDQTDAHPLCRGSIVIGDYATGSKSRYADGGRVFA